ncbi:MAG: signal recognition particle-docking protein FtsY [Verrucomicrobia bacterium]|nr:signal recognition particle-docking protein FtsY [Verrucomicrobiota bacterium]MDA1085556.1 signal recognition particle-docking protein FtsY [Verrucomicrobiota bacterium]
MAKWMQALARTRDSLSGGLVNILLGSDSLEESQIEEMQARLIAADIPARLAMAWTDAARNLPDADALHARIGAQIKDVLDGHPPFTWQAPASPLVVLVVGVNGSGKTTTTAKLASMLKRLGMKPLLAAADTFRAAGSDQLRIWGERVGCEVVYGAQGQDASAVAYDAVQAGIARQSDVVLIDTAGRMHTRGPLMQELQKMTRSIGKAMPGAPHERWIVLDASLGHNAISQARLFHEAVGLTGVVISKLDGSSRGGFLLSIRQELDLPLYFAGLGEGEEDLVPFEAAEYVSAVLG